MGGGVGRRGRGEGSGGGGRGRTGCPWEPTHDPSPHPPPARGGGGVLTPLLPHQAPNARLAGFRRLPSRSSSAVRIAGAACSNRNGGLITSSPQPFSRAGSSGSRSNSSAATMSRDAALLQCRVEAAHRRAVLDRIPGGEHAGGKSRMAVRQSVQQVRKLVRRLEGRVDQHQAAPLLRRQQCAQRLPGVALMHRHLAVAREVAAQFEQVLGVQFAAGQPVVRAAAGRGSAAGEPG